MRILWTSWQISRSPQGSPGSDPLKNELKRDPALVELQRDLMITRSIVITGFVLGLSTIGVLWLVEHLRDGFTVLFWALACYASGALMGFLFGIPRVLQAPPSTGFSRTSADVPSSEPRESYRLIVNTNLDDVSDWLTKIVVGVGLVELERIPGLIYRLATEIGGGTGKQYVPFIIAVILYFTIVGFMSGYLTTRMFFQRAFRIADLAAGESCDRELFQGSISAAIVSSSQAPRQAAPQT
jgi:hypothetical protein